MRSALGRPGTFWPVATADSAQVEDRSGNIRPRVIRSAVALGISAVALYLLAPALLEVFASWPRVRQLNPLWLLAMTLTEAVSILCLCAVQRLAMRTRPWFPIVASQLACGALGRVLPGGSATAATLQYRMLVQGGVPSAAAASGLTASSLLVFGMLLALPVLAVPAIIRGLVVPHGLEQALWIGIAVFGLLFCAGAVALTTDRPLAQVGALVERVRNRLRRRKPPIRGTAQRLLAERDIVARVLGERWWEALGLSIGKWLAEYLALLGALAAVGARVNPFLALIAYCVASFLGQVPITPGGLGFVEAGLTGTLVLAGVPAAAAAVATLAFRLVSYWLPLPAGVVGWVLHRRRYGERPVAAGGQRLS